MGFVDGLPCERALRGQERVDTDGSHEEAAEHFAIAFEWAEWCPLQTASAGDTHHHVRGDRREGKHDSHDGEEAHALRGRSEKRGDAFDHRR